MFILVALKQEIPTLHTRNNVHITGLGKVNAAMHATRLILEHSQADLPNIPQLAVRELL